MSETQAGTLTEVVLTEYLNQNYENHNIKVEFRYDVFNTGFVIAFHRCGYVGVEFIVESLEFGRFLDEVVKDLVGGIIEALDKNDTNPTTRTRFNSPPLTWGL